MKNCEVCKCASKRHDWKLVRKILFDKKDFSKYKIVCHECGNSCGTFYQYPPGYYYSEVKAMFDDQTD